MHRPFQSIGDHCLCGEEVGPPYLVQDADESDEHQLAFLAALDQVLSNRNETVVGGIKLPGPRKQRSAVHGDENNLVVSLKSTMRPAARDGRHGRATRVPPDERVPGIHADVPAVSGFHRLGAGAGHQTSG
jgi:hypothetical protein